MGGGGGGVTIIGGSCHKYHFCRDKTRDKTRLLSLQKYACRDKTFVATKSVMFVMFCRDKHVLNFIATSILLSRQKTCVFSRQTRVSRDTCLSRQNYVCRDKNMLVATKLNSQAKFCRDKNDTCELPPMIVFRWGRREGGREVVAERGRGVTMAACYRHDMD